MKKLRFAAFILFLTGFAFCLLPFHVTFTGFVLILLAAGLFVLTVLKSEMWKNILVCAMSLCVIILTVLMAQVQIYGLTDITTGAEDYAVVLGAQTHPGGVPSRTLRERLDRGLLYLEENPDKYLVVSGGQGDDEQEPEADVMYAYLQSKGADMRRVMKETESHTTRENLENTVNMTGSGKLAIITSEFHRYRADYIARSLGLEAGGLSAKTGDDFLRGNYYLREIFSMVKAIAQAK